MRRRGLHRELPRLALAAALVSCPSVHADPADDVPRIQQQRQLKRDGEFEAALEVARVLFAESRADPSRSDLERRNRGQQVRTLEMLVAMDPTARAEITEAEQEWWRAWQLYGEGRYRDAEAPSRRSLALREKHLGTRHDDVASSLDQLGLMLSLQNRFNEAEVEFLRALATFDAVLGESSAASAVVHNNLATMYSAQADYAKAEERFRIHLRIFREYHAENEEEIATALSNLAVTIGNRGDPGAAEPLLQEALRIRRRIHPPDHPSVGLALNLIGSNLWARGDARGAETLYREALAVRERAHGPDHPNVATSLSNLATVMSSSGRHGEALALHERALVIRRERYGETHRKTALTLHKLGHVQWRMDRVEEAERLFQEARAITVEVHDERHPAVAAIDRSIARLEAKRGRLDVAEARFASALDVYRETYGDDHREVTNVLAHLGNLALRTEQWNLAVDRFQRAVGSFEATRDRFTSPKDRSSFQSSPDPRLAAALLQADRATEAWPHVERWHGRLLGDLVRVALPETAGRLAPSDYGREIPLEAIRRSLSSRTAIIGWLDVPVAGGETLSFGWIVRRVGPVRWVRLEPIPDRKDGEDLAGRMREALVLTGAWPFRVQDTGAIDGDSRALAANRIDPLLPHLDGVDSIVLVPSGSMHGVPVEALLDEHGEPLGRRWVVSYAPSAGIHAWLAARAKPSERRSALLLGDPPFPEPFQALPGAREEVARIAEFFPETRLLIGADANERNLVDLAIRGDLARYDAIHLATHAVADAERPERSALVLSSENQDALVAALAGDRIHDGFLTADEIVREWSLDADLVTLSGCGTALGREVAAEGFLGFAHAFFQAGARSLVLSLWKVDDEATSLLMTRFYENLVRRGHGKAEALSEAREWLRSWQDETGRSPFRHPAYWSAFVLIGEPGRSGAG